ncbi:MAG: aspartyl protease family protein [Chloroflexota bacterium]
MRILFLNLLLLVVSFGNAQSPKAQLNLINSADLAVKDFYKEFNYENKFGYIIIPVEIGNENYRYIFDTGGYNTLISAIMDKNNLPDLMQVEVGSSNQIKSTIALTKIPSVKIGGIDFNDVGALNFDFDDSPQIGCYTNGGLIGKSIIKNAVWQINKEESKIILTDKIEELQHLKNAIRLKVDFDRTLNPFIKIKVNGKNMKFMLDLGYGGLVSFTENSGKKLKAKDLIEIIGEGSVSANGVINESIFMNNLESLKIDDFELKKQVGFYAKSNNYNLVGSGILDYFIVTLNFPNNELLLYPLDSNNEEEKSSFGFDLNKNDNSMYVSKLFLGQSAEQAGLKLNDQVISINNREFLEVPYCEFYDYVQKTFEENIPIDLNWRTRQKE